jgi:hypothetical protein
MAIKNVSFLFLLVVIGCGFGSAYAHNNSTQCTGKVEKKRRLLFVEAEKCEQDFMNARAQCLQAGDCDSNQVYKDARLDLFAFTVGLAEHIKALEKATNVACHVCEKTEAQDIKERLAALLRTAL